MATQKTHLADARVEENAVVVEPDDALVALAAVVVARRALHDAADLARRAAVAPAAVRVAQLEREARDRSQPAG